MRPIHTILCILLLPLSLLTAGCSILGDDSYLDRYEEFEEGFYYYGGGEQITLYQSRRLITVQFDELVTGEQAQELLDQYGLVPFPGVHEKGYEPEDLVRWSILVLQLPLGAKLSDYTVRRHPDPERHTPFAENLPFGSRYEIRYAMPSYALNKSGELQSRLFLNDIIRLNSDLDYEEVKEIVDYYGLDIIQHSIYGTYTLQLRPGVWVNSLELANTLHEQDFSNWSYPNFQFFGAFTTEEK